MCAIFYSPPLKYSAGEVSPKGYKLSVDMCYKITLCAGIQLLMIGHVMLFIWFNAKYKSPIQSSK